MSNAPRRALGDDVLVHSAARRLAVQVAALVGAAMVLLVVLVTLFVVRDAKAAADTLLRSTVARIDDVGDPPPGAWLVMARGNALLVSPGLPTVLTGELATLRSQARSTATLARVEDDEQHPYRVATLRRPEVVVQVVLDLHEQREEQARLVRAMTGASIAALLFAGLLGVTLGRRAVRPLAEALVLQRRFVADASHELRTPLTLLSTRAQVLDRALRSAGVDRPLLADSRGVVQDVQRLGAVVEDLLLAADPRADDGHERVDLRTVVETVVDSAGAHAAHCDVRLEYRDDAPSAVHVEGSATALRRAVLALLDNAIEHTPPGGEVTVGLRRERSSTVVSVGDTGPGIAPEAASAVQRRFASGGHRAGRTHYGLGLALTHDVANRHGGQLRLVPSAIGATFELVLPALDG